MKGKKKKRFLSSSTYRLRQGKKRCTSYHAEERKAASCEKKKRSKNKNKQKTKEEEAIASLKVKKKKSKSETKSETNFFFVFWVDLTVARRAFKNEKKALAMQRATPGSRENKNGHI